MTRRLTWPLQLVGGQLATHRGDSRRDVTQCIAILVRTPRGSRPLSPNVGFDDPLFGDSVESADLERRLRELEPRATIDVTVEYPSPGEARRRIVVGLADSNSNAPEAG